MRNKQLELELVERRFAMENMRDLLARIQRENDVVSPFPPPFVQPSNLESEKLTQMLTRGFSRS